MLEGGWWEWLFFKGLGVVDAVLDSGIRLHFGNDDFEVLQFKIFTEHGKVELIDPFLRVFTESCLNFHDSFRNMEDEPGFFFNPFTENPEDFRENLDQGNGEFFIERIGFQSVVTADPGFEMFQHAPLKHIDQAGRCFMVTVQFLWGLMPERFQTIGNALCIRADVRHISV